MAWYMPSNFNRCIFKITEQLFLLNLLLTTSTREVALPAHCFSAIAMESEYSHIALQKLSKKMLFMQTATSCEYCKEVAKDKRPKVTFILANLLDLTRVPHMV